MAAYQCIRKEMQDSGVLIWNSVEYKFKLNRSESVWILLGTSSAHMVGNMQGFKMGLRKMQNYCVHTSTEFTDIWLICKVFRFRFSGTRKTTLNKHCVKLRVS
jgi:hypothetical protein